jgi:hypothetical protein
VVLKALSDAKLRNTTYRLLLHNNDYQGRSQYWFQQKFLGSESSISVQDRRNNTFKAQPTVTAEEAPEVGFLVFGCSTDFSIPSDERFRKDAENLRFITEYLTKHTKFARLALMVICYRAPISDGRTALHGRRRRVELVSV